MQPDERIPVVWICGPPGIGKTTVGWRIFNNLANAGALTGYVDIDQLGNCYPDPLDDLGRHRVKSRNLGAAVETYRLAGARCVIVSGVIDPQGGPHLDAIDNADVTMIRLRADPEALTARFLGRGTSPELIDDVLAEAESYEHIDAAVVIDTTGCTVDDVVTNIHSAINTRTVPSIHPASQPTPGPIDASGPVMLLFGPTGVGKSAVGWQVWTSTFSSGAISAYVDLDQIGFLRPAPSDDPANHRVKTRNLAAIWRRYRSIGVRSLVVVGPVEDHDALSRYVDALAGADLTLVRLHAHHDALTERLLARGRGEGVALPGDELVGRSDTLLRQIADSAAVTAAATEIAKLGDISIDTSTRTPQEIATMILRQMASEE